MRIEPLPGMTNVVRFPVERRARPTLDLLRDIAPDVREVLSIADAFGMEAPVHDLRERVDAATAEHIADQAPRSEPAPAAMLAGMLDPVIAAAVAACRAAHDASLEAAEAQEALLRAQTAGYFWLDPLRERAEALTQRAAEHLLIAHARAEEAEGVARAVRIAREGAVWSPRDVWAEMEELIEMARSAG